MKGSIRRRGSSWQGRVDLGIDPKTGKRLVRSVTKKTKREVQEELAAVVTELRKGEYVEPSKLSFSRWHDMWVDAAIRPKKRARTVETYSSVIKNHLKPALGAILIQRLQPTDIEKYFGESRLSQSTLAQHSAILHSALASAERKGIVQRNVHRLVDGKPKKQEREDVRELVWTPAEAKHFLAFLSEEGTPQQRAFYSLAIETGMRKAELCGQRWRNVNLETCKIRIIEQLAKPGREPKFVPVKSMARTISITPELAKILAVHRKHQLEVRMANGPAYRDFGLVFARETRGRATDQLGGPLPMNHLGQREFSKLAAKAGVKRVTIHGLRHTSATISLLAGVPPKVVAERLGHRRVSTTEDIYQHVLESMDRDAATAVGALIHGEGS